MLNDEKSQMVHFHITGHILFPILRVFPNCSTTRLAYHNDCKYAGHKNRVENSEEPHQHYHSEREK